MGNEEPIMLSLPDPSVPSTADDYILPPTEEKVDGVLYIVRRTIEQSAWYVYKLEKRLPKAVLVRPVEPDRRNRVSEVLGTKYEKLNFYSLDGERKLDEERIPTSDSILEYVIDFTGRKKVGPTPIAVSQKFNIPLETAGKMLSELKSIGAVKEKQNQYRDVNRKGITRYEPNPLYISKWQRYQSKEI